MGAKLSVVPSYVIYDRSSQAQTTLTGQGITAPTGQLSFMYDGDLDSSYNLNASGGALASLETIFVLDYGKILINNLVCFDVDFGYSRAGGSGQAQYEISYSIDGINFVLIDGASFDANTSTNNTGSYLFLALRYLKFRLLTPSSGTSSNSEIKLYEVRLMGSG